MLSHGNILSICAGTNYFLKLVPTDVYISYLPLAHIFERICFAGMANSGGAIGFYSGDILKITEDL